MENSDEHEIVFQVLAAQWFYGSSKPKNRN